MFRDYAEYERYFEKMMEQAPESIKPKLKKKSPAEFERENYYDKVEWYLVEEWGTDSFIDIFYGKCEENDSEVETPEEKRARELHEGVHDIVWDGWEVNAAIPLVARAVFVYLFEKKAIHQNQWSG